MDRLPKRRRWLPALLLALLLAGCDVVALPEQRAQPPDLPNAPTASSAALPAPSPTVLPAPDLLARAIHARDNGDYEAAASDLSALLDAHPSAPEVRPAQLYLAESYAERGRWTSALELLRAFLAHGPEDDLYGRGLFLMARGYEGAGAFADAVATYERYRLLQTPLEPYARLRQAAQEAALGRNEAAATSYAAAADAGIARGERAGAYEKAAALRRDLSQNDAALALYRKLLDPQPGAAQPLATLPEYRAKILGLAGPLAAQLGATDDARTWWREIAQESPAAPEALDAVTQLAATGQPLEPRIAARVAVEHEQWDAALTAFDSAIVAANVEDALDLRRQRALARRGKGDFPAALDELAAVAAESPNSQAGRQAQLDWVQTKGQGGDPPAAIQGYREFAAAYPDDQHAPEALRRAATLLELAGDAEGATAQRVDLGRRYPASAQGQDALDEAAWWLFQAGRGGEARDAWSLLRQHVGGTVASRAAFWAAHTLDAHDAEYAILLDAAVAAAPDSYFGARAAELLGKPMVGEIPIGAPIGDDSWREAEKWLSSWVAKPSYDLAQPGYPPELAQAIPVVRAIALRDVGLESDAIAEWNEARNTWGDDPIKLYVLARLSHDHGVPYIALKAAEDLARLSPDKGFANAPEALRRLIFPTPYSDLMVAQGRERGLDPLALYATLRQESLFNPGAVSWVGARGLAQVMPATAEGIAQNLSVPDFHEDDLLHPAVSIRFGAFYLDHQVDMMEGSLQGGLAAYNGGPGNAQRWASGTSVTDPDRFTESIDYTETRDYVKLVYGYYGAYRRLYRSP